MLLFGIFINYIISAVVFPCVQYFVLPWSAVNRMSVTSSNKVHVMSSVKKQTSCTSVDKINEKAQAEVLLDAGLRVRNERKQPIKCER